MKLVLLGLPGSGKGTQAKLISEKYHVEHFSTGDVFRKNILLNSEFGIKIKQYMDSGRLVPDDFTISLVEQTIKKEIYNKGYLFDGFPRTVNQSILFEEFLAEHGEKLTKVILIDLPQELIFNRMTGRRICSNCGATYNVNFNPPKVEGVCDICSEKALVQRSDDKEETVKKRLDIYANQTEPLVDYYEKENLLARVDGTKGIDEVFRSICSIIDKEILNEESN